MKDPNQLVEDEGYKANAEGKKLKDNPWSERDASDLHYKWRKGWVEYESEKGFFNLNGA